MKVISMFSGAGGLDLGFKMAGHEIVWANDNYEEAVKTYKRNIGEHIVSDSIENISASSIPDAEILIGGFPCQGFSVANWNRTSNDTRNLLYKHMIRILSFKKPKYFIAENVKGLTSLSKGRALKFILEDFASAGYEIEHTVLNAADFGVPQKRLRLIIFGRKKGLKDRVKFPPGPTHSDRVNGSQNGIKPWVSVGEALSGIPEPEEASDLPNHTCSEYKLRFNGYLGHRAIDPDQPAPTVTGRGDTKGGVVVLHHPKNHRRMTARELATVQSFPMDFIFEGSRTAAYIQIANAVPPLLAKAIASIF